MTGIVTSDGALAAPEKPSPMPFMFRKTAEMRDCCDLPPLGPPRKSALFRACIGWFAPRASWRVSGNRRRV
ncbi:MAG: hypothetical protein ABW217_22630, partial [Polyangiaceae bacterium]